MGNTKVALCSLLFTAFVTSKKLICLCRRGRAMNITHPEMGERGIYTLNQERAMNQLRREQVTENASHLPRKS